MPQQITTAVENNFTKGLITEATALNFPENGASDADNCEFTLKGNVVRRLGFEYEPNFSSRVQDRTNCAMATYKWNNAGGDGNTQIVAQQVGATVSFYRSSTATIAAPLSTQLLAWTIPLASFAAPGVTFDTSKEAQFSDGNGYLFIYHPDCDPIYCTYDAGTIVGNRIDVKIRDFQGVIDGELVSTRPSTLTTVHNYNLSNQGWTQGSAWYASSGTNWIVATGSRALTVLAGIPGITLGDAVVLYGHMAFGFGGANQYLAYGNVTSYVGTTLTINIVGVNSSLAGFEVEDQVVSPTNAGYLGTWNTEVGGYPSNADVWWYFKNASNVFNPGTTLANVTLNTGNAPRGHYILSAFDQQRDLVSALAGITDVTTTKRPRTGTWFQGRVWYAGVDASQPATGNANYTTWTESIYFSQIITEVTQLGNCYQTNDPTSQELFDLLPTDGGVIQIQGCGSIYKLFPIQNGMLVFAANGIWFITGSQGIGFSANDYTITKISAIKNISSTSFVDVEGLPYFWNEDGIYSVQPQQGGGLAVSTLTYNTIDSFYNEIPLSSKQYVRGDYDPINYTIKWVYKSDEAETVKSRYEYDRILNYNTANKAFYPYSIDISDPLFPYINGVIYVVGPGGVGAALSTFKYPSSIFTVSENILFAEEYRDNYADWNLAGTIFGGHQYDSYFVTGYKIRGQAIKRYQPQYVQMWSGVDEADSGYKIQGVWDYSISGNSNRWTTIQNISIPGTGYFSVVSRRHKIRGHGYALQFKVISQDGKPFDIQGWAVVDTVNQGT